MHRYKIFLKTGERVEVEADNVLPISKGFENSIYRYDFVETTSEYTLKLKAQIYANMIDGWIKLPENEERSSEER